MTEAEWIACIDPKQMLQFLWTSGGGRKFWLFAVACCLRIWSLLEDERSRNAVVSVEQFADGRCDQSELRLSFEQAGEAAEAAHWENRAGSVQTAAEAAAIASCIMAMSPDVLCNLAATVAEAVGDQTTDDNWNTTWNTPGRTNEEAWKVDQRIYREAEAIEFSAQADLLRDIFGNPFRPTFIDPTLLVPGTVMLAQEIYDERAFARMPILGDVLEAAGCDDADIVNHCRQPGPHVRGCWVVDLILGKS